MRPGALEELHNPPGFLRVVAEDDEKFTLGMALLNN